ncbi:MAG: hypothetical protein HC828_00160 [Blastochloris sp.]|nr:hypothetical protein [Blastochloris sp.]
MFTDIFIWWFAIQALGLIALPLTHVVFNALPDYGYAFSKALGLLLTGYLAWMLAMLGLAPFGAALLVVCALLVGVVGLLALQRQWQSARTPLFPRLADLLTYEVVFVAALLFVVAIRANNPDPWGTERPMDFALFNAIRQSTMFPPHDPWLSGYSINYYYFGYLLMAAMSLLTGLEPSVAYNLALALIFGLTALGIVGLIFNLIRATDMTGKTDGDVVEETPRRRVWPLIWRPLAGILTVIMVLVAANQGGALQVMSGSPMILALEGGDMARAVANGLGTREPLTLDRPFNGWDFDETAVIEPRDMVAEFNWWNPSRALWDSFPDPANPAAQPERRYTITEFPLFSFWLGDMHPHVMSLPFVLLVMALALNTMVRPTLPAYASGLRGWLELIVTGILIGGLYIINSWDLPTYLLLFMVALFLLHIRLHVQQDVSTEQTVGSVLPSFTALPWKSYWGQTALIGVMAFLLFTPFYLTFRSLVGGKEALIDLPLLATVTRTIGFVNWTKTPLHSFLIIFGLFLVPLLAYVAVQWQMVFAQVSRSLAAARAENDQQNDIDDAQTGGVDKQEWNVLRLMPWMTLLVFVFGVLIGFPLLFLLPLAVYAILLALAKVCQPVTSFVLWGFALVCLVCFGTDVVYIRDTFEGQSTRMNTIFKFYYQAWAIWGVLAGYALWWLYGRYFSLRRMGGYLFPLVFVPLLIGALVYPSLTAGKMFREPNWIGLTGETPRQNTLAGAASIEWLRTNVAGDAVILEVVGGSYDGGGLGVGGVSASTGLQTVLGWPGHERQWRGGDRLVLEEIAVREADVAMIYNTTDLEEARRLLQQYQVDYVYVGYAEQNTYAPEGLNKFGQLGTPVFQQGEVTIYAVLASVRAER